MVSEQTLLFSPIKLKLFFGPSHILNNEMTNNFNDCECVILLPFCVCNASCVINYISTYPSIRTEIGTNTPQCNT